MKKHRKLAAIMFTDIVGYTSLMSKDEQKAFQILQKNRDTQKPHIKKFNGELLKEIGDGTLSCFSSAVDAVYCAMEIQRSLKNESEFSLRIGIHVGDVVFSEGDVFGDGVNVASRIENLAEPGGICVSDQVYINISNQHDIHGIFLGAKTLKNVDHAIRIYAITTEELSPILNISNKNDKSSIEKRQPSIAVLPFSDMSPEKDQEWFCDGMAEEILNALANVENLLVVARTSTFAFKGKQEDIREIGNKLNVETVLEGSVRKAGNRLRITVQLINVMDGFHLLSDSYDRELEDVFAIQDEISLAIAETLKVKLLRKEKKAIKKHPTENIEAYNFYLLGLYHYNKGDWEKGLEYCQQAIDKDSDFALAYAGIAEGYSRTEKIDEARNAVEKALQIDNSLAEAHTVLAWISLYYGWDFLSAESGFKKAIELNPGYAGAHQQYAKYLRIMGRFDESIIEIKRARELDPMPLGTYAEAIAIYLLLEKYNEALAQYRKSIEIDPDNVYAQYHLARLYCKQEKFSKAIEIYRKLKDIYGDSDSLEARIGYTYGLSGDRVAAEKILQELIEKSKEEPVLSIHIALIYLGLGETDKAFEWLEKAYSAREINLLFIKVAPEYVNIRLDSRYTSLLKKIGFDTL
ncbi:tetratricopeptide repeat protein [Candidatus Latescibacterota bacterium]